MGNFKNLSTQSKENKAFPPYNSRKKYDRDNNNRRHRINSKTNDETKETFTKNNASHALSCYMQPRNCPICCVSSPLQSKNMDKVGVSTASCDTRTSGNANKFLRSNYMGFPLSASGKDGKTRTSASTSAPFTLQRQSLLPVCLWAVLGIFCKENSVSVLGVCVCWDVLICSTK